MASYIADTKNETEAKNELITLLMGVAMPPEILANESAPETSSTTMLSDGTIGLMPPADQRADFVKQARQRAVQLGQTAGLWQDEKGANVAAKKAVRDYLTEQEKQKLASILRETARKLESAAAHLYPINKSFVAWVDDAGGGTAKRKRGKDLDELHGKLEDAAKAVRDFKKVKQSQKSATVVCESARAETETTLTPKWKALNQAHMQENFTSEASVTSQDQAELGHPPLVECRKVLRPKSKKPPLGILAVQDGNSEASIRPARTTLQARSGATTQTAIRAMTEARGLYDDSFPARFFFQTARSLH